MTLIAGVRCRDGVAIAADTALTRESHVFHGSKLHYHIWPGKYKTAVAFASNHIDLGHMASVRIRAGLNKLSEFPEHAIRDQIDDSMTSTSRRIDANWPIEEHWKHEPYLVVAAHTPNERAIYFAERGVVTSINQYAFYGTGADLATHYAERFLLDERGTIGISVASAVHILSVIFRIAKKTTDTVGRNTEIIGIRWNEDSLPFFLPPQNSSFANTMDRVESEMRWAIIWSLNQDKGAVTAIDLYAGEAKRLLRDFLAEQKHIYPKDQLTKKFIDDGVHPWHVDDLDFSGESFSSSVA